MDLHRVVKRAAVGQRRALLHQGPRAVFRLRTRAGSAGSIREQARGGEQPSPTAPSARTIRHCRIVEDYNREDCESTLKLRDWLETLRAEVIEGGQDLPRPELADGAASDEVSELDQELQELRDRLLADVPADRGRPDPTKSGRGSRWPT